jgi:predicted PurR-regulated permease PerM
MTKITSQPFYAKFAFVLLSLVIIFSVLWIGRGVIMPPMFALLFAILLDPIAKFLNKKARFPRVLSILVSVLLALLVLAGIIFFISWQVTDMMSDWQKIKQNVNTHIDNLQNYIWRTVNLNKTEQEQMLDEATSGSGSSIVGSTLLSITDALMNFVLVPIYIFLFILYKDHFKKFLCKVFKPMHHPVLKDVLMQVRVSIRSYISGLMIQMLTVSVLTTIGYMIIGLDYAILLGVITGLLNLIPYVGIMTAAVLSMAATLTGSAEVDVIIGIVVVNIIVQFIDNNLLVPMIVSSKVEINAMVSITGIIIGGALGGVAGMFLAIPYIAITKVVFDRIPELNAWGYLMGDDLPKTFEWRKIRLPYYGPDTQPAEFIHYTTTHTQPEPKQEEDEKQD